VLTVVEEVADPKMEISLADAKKKNPTAEVGTEILTAKPTDVLGRIAAQTAKQVILQKVAKPSGTQFTTSITPAWANW